MSRKTLIFAMSKPFRGMGILPMLNNRVRHGQDAHATGFTL